jgi:ABC-type nitrate/sulfonate/bicarbonate transport system permease component
VSLVKNATKRTATGRWIWLIAGMVAFFVAWELAALYMKSTNPRGEAIFPSWTVILTESVKQFEVFLPFGVTGSGYSAAAQVLFVHSLVTAQRVLIGTTTGIVAGIAIGLLMAYSTTIRDLSSATIQILRTIPLLALIPLFILWFGGRNVGMYLFIAFAVFVMIVISTYHAALNVPPAPARFARTLGASRARMFRDVVLPGLLPELFASIRVVVALSWSFALGAEFTGAQEGLGFLMIQSEKSGFLGRVIVVTTLFTLYAVVIDQLLVQLRRRLLRWGPA